VEIGEGNPNSAPQPDVTLFTIFARLWFVHGGRAQRSVSQVLTGCTRDEFPEVEIKTGAKEPRLKHAASGRVTKAASVLIHCPENVCA